jgi:hypothetical protein
MTEEKPLTLREQHELKRAKNAAARISSAPAKMEAAAETPPSLDDEGQAGKDLLTRRVGEAVHRAVENGLRPKKGRSLTRVPENVSHMAPSTGRRGIQHGSGDISRMSLPDRRITEKRACTHKFGLAGGFSECSACGIKKRW